MLKLLVVVASLFIASTAAADSRADAAASWVEAAIRGNAPKLTKPIKLVFDSGGVFAANSTCAKLRIGTIKNDAEMTAFAGCVKQAAVKLGVDKQPAVPGKGLRVVDRSYLKHWFPKSFYSSLVVPAGQRLIGTSFNRRDMSTEASGFAVMIYVLVDTKDQITAAYVHTGYWAYPI